jgi:hypothetical protein
VTFFRPKIAPTLAHIADAIFAVPPHRFAGGGEVKCAARMARHCEPYPGVWQIDSNFGLTTFWVIPGVAGLWRQQMGRVIFT